MAAVHAVWALDRAPQAPRRVWRDWVLVAVLAATALGEGLLRPGVVWRPVVLPLAVVLVVPLLWRRARPLLAVAAVFGPWILLDAAALAAGMPTSLGLSVTVYVLLLPYSLLRWGSGREILTGLGILVTAAVLGVAGNYTGPVDAAAAAVVTTFPALLGVVVRLRTGVRLRELDQVRLREREQLARELHDTVAHHVSAMVVRAQAGRVVAATNPAAAVEALQVIEAEGSRTLTEMRQLVSALREHDDPHLLPGRGLGDLAGLVRLDGGPPLVDVQVSGDLADLGPTVGAAVFRIAQESVTNALRHSRRATRVLVRVAREGDAVRLSVEDDGEPTLARNQVGFGIVGMTERASLLGGSLVAGPGPGRGWVVTALLPWTA